MIPANLAQWAIRHHVSIEALADLAAILGATVPPVTPAPPTRHQSEAYVQSQVRLEAPEKGVRLWRNNVGVLQDETGRPVRYGLANDSKALNEKLKSSDLVGWRRLLITQAMVGHIVAQTVVRECKPYGWTWRGTDREVAQLAWIQLVAADGGDARFTTGPGTL